MVDGCHNSKKGSSLVTNFYFNGALPPSEASGWANLLRETMPSIKPSPLSPPPCLPNDAGRALYLHTSPIIKDLSDLKIEDDHLVDHYPLVANIPECLDEAQNAWDARSPSPSSIRSRRTHL
jgi:hypothetical protein